MEITINLEIVYFWLIAFGSLSAFVGTIFLIALTLTKSPFAGAVLLIALMATVITTLTFAMR